ncbi:MAG: glycosyltransferase [Candidatus Geothermarchaeales archaeon]
MSGEPSTSASGSLGASRRRFFGYPARGDSARRRSVDTSFFENTEFLYSNNIARLVEKAGYSGIYTEGIERILGWRSPNYVYRPRGTERMKMLLRNYGLSDDIGFRFSSRWWSEWPLTADKYSPGAVSEDERTVLREMYQIGEDERMLFFVGSLVSVRGADRLVMALPTILENLKAKLVIVGRGEMEDHLLNLVRTEGLSEEVKFRFEFISWEERIKHYAACDAAVFPSLYEPFGIVALEAMSMEKPVVVGAKGVS